MLIIGSDLNSRQRAQVLSAFVHRHTAENAQRHGVSCMLCKISGPFPMVTGQRGARRVWERSEWHAYHVPAVSDQRWLADHAFHFIADGSRLMIRHAAEPAYLAKRATVAK